MMKLNLRVGPVRMQITNSQKINISEMNTQKIPNSHVCSLDEIKSKRINANETVWHVCSMDNRESNSVVVNTFSMDESE